MKRLPLLKTLGASGAALALMQLAACGGGGDEVPETPDAIPSVFSFVDQTNAALSTLTESAEITVLGINQASDITIANGEYQVNGGSWSSASGTVTVGQSVKVRHTSSASRSTATDTTLTIGGVSDTFTTTTLPPGFVNQGGLRWAPDNLVATANWSAADAYCAGTAIEGQTGWRLPTVAELQSLQSSGAATNQGWALGGIWASNFHSSGNHWFVAMVNGNSGSYPDSGTVAFSCVRSLVV